MRDAAFRAIHDEMQRDPSIVILTIDLGAFVLDEIIKEFPHRVINVGIAEQLAVSMAAGMAIAGKRPIVYGISMILVRRALAQITMDVGANNLPVILLGLGAGHSFPGDGISHHGTEDVPIMQTVPNLTVVTPTDECMIASEIRVALRRQSPTYIRFDKQPNAGTRNASAGERGL